jgi:ABC-type Fe3+ transport system substrate-binding protein
MRTTPVLFALALLFAVPARLPAEEFDLEIITPHYEGIQAEFERGFVRQLGRPLKIRWIRKGTGEIIQQLDAQEKAGKGGSFGLDVFFGGGVPDHDLAASKGYLEKANLPEEVLAAIPSEIAGVANYDARHLWLGSALSAFGILKNKRGLANQNLPDVTTWADLGDPRMFSWVVISDPRKSASVRVCYELILQQYGWEKGWPLLMQIAANARVITAASSDVPNEVATGNVLAGPCIDFYAFGRVAEAGPDVLAYINPTGGSAITPDPISMLRKPPHRELAEKFIAYVLSPAGQKLWVFPVGAAGGPTEHALYRMPVRPDVCAQVAAGTTPIKDPYAEAAAGTFRKMDGELQRKRNKLVGELMGAALIDLHTELKDAWKALNDGGRKPEALAEWNKLPFSEAEGLDAAKKLEAADHDAKKLTRDWTKLFKDKYERVKKLAK